MKFNKINIWNASFILVAFCAIAHGSVDFGLDKEYFINTIGESNTFSRCVASGDLDHDGDIDIVVSDRFSREIVLFLNDGVGNLSYVSSVFIIDVQEVGGTRIILLEDVNGDGLIDLVTAGSGGSNVFLNLGHDEDSWMSFGDPDLYFAGDNPHWIDTADMNNDGYPDLLVSDYGEYLDPSFGEAGWYVFLNDGEGTFDDGIYISLGIDARCISIVGQDFNNDTLMDIAVIGHFKRVHLYTNLGRDAKTDEWLGVTYEGYIETQYSSASIKSFDADDDHDYDLIVAHRTYDQTSLLINDGNGNFMYQPISTVSGELAQPVDINNDGQIDFALANKLSGVFQIMINDGEGGFVQSFTSPIHNYVDAKFLVCDYIDADLKLDIVLVNSYPGQDKGSIKVFLNKSACILGEDVNGNGNVEVTDLLAIIAAWTTDDPSADLDGSGTVDVADLLMVISAWGPCE